QPPRGQSPGLLPARGVARPVFGTRVPPLIHSPRQVFRLARPPGRLVGRRKPTSGAGGCVALLPRPPGHQPSGCFDPLVGCSHTATARTEHTESYICSLTLTSQRTVPTPRLAVPALRGGSGRFHGHLWRCSLDHHGTLIGLRSGSGR